MLCQRASLCPAEEQEDKHQQTTGQPEVGYLDGAPSSRKFLTLITIYTLEGKWATTPLLIHPTSKGWWPSYSPLASSTTQRRCLLLPDLQWDLLNTGLSLVSPSHTQQAHAQGPRNWSCFRVYLTPFTPFKSPFSSESRVKITLWLRLWSWGRTKKTLNVAVCHLIVWLTYHSTVQRQIFIHRAEDVLYLKVKKRMKTNLISKVTVFKFRSILISWFCWIPECG